jgi:hypothetical protein
MPPGRVPMTGKARRTRSIRSGVGLLLASATASMN